MPQLKLTNENKQALIKKATEYINSLTETPTELKLPITIKPKTITKREVLFSPTAWAKMTTLIAQSEKEVGWNMLIKKLNKHTYYIYDCILYPQNVTAATINPDDTETVIWRQNLPDKIINNIHGQGHSHVNFSVNPSSVDLNYYKEITNELKKGQYYIFLIRNKLGDMYCRVVEIDDNYIYTTNECNIDIYTTRKEKIKNWVKNEMKKYVKETKTYNQKYNENYDWWSNLNK